MDNYWAIYRGIVTDNDDIKLGARTGRVKVDVASIKVKNVWAEPAMPVGGQPEKGQYIIPRVGDKVFLFFDGGNVHSAIYFATSPCKVDIPPAFVTIDELITSRASSLLSAIKCGTQTWSEPAPPTSIEYPYNQGIKFPGGVLINVDDSSHKTRIQMHHPSGSYADWTNEGEKITRVSSNEYEIIMSDKNLYIGGTLAQNVVNGIQETITGSCFSETTGSVSKIITGEVQESITGMVTKSITGDVTDVTAGQVTRSIAGSFTLMLGASLSVIFGATAPTPPPPTRNIKDSRSGGDAVGYDSGTVMMSFSESINVTTKLFVLNLMEALIVNAPQIVFEADEMINILAPLIQLGVPGGGGIIMAGQSMMGAGRVCVEGNCEDSVYSAPVSIKMDPPGMGMVLFGAL